MKKLPTALLGLLLTLTAFGQPMLLRGSLNLAPRTGVDAAGGLAYTVGDNNLTIVDVSNPDLPSVVGQVTPNVSQVSDVQVSGGYAYCAGQASGLVVIDVVPATSPVWVTNLSLSAAVRSVAVHDTLVAVATASSVVLVGVRDPAHPHVLASYMHSASWIEFNGPAQLLHVGSTTGAFSLQIHADFAGDTTFAFTLEHQYGSESLTPLSVGGSYTNAVHSASVRVLNASDYSLAGQYTSTASIGAIVSSNTYSFIGLVTGSVQYLDQRQATPLFVSASGIPSSATGLALTQIGNQPLVIVAHQTGVTVLSYSPLAADPAEHPAMPNDLSLSAYPNPFNNSTELSLAVPVSGMYELKLFDLLGREMLSRTLVLSGSSRETLDFSKFAAGNYIVRLSGNDRQSSLRLLYLP